VVRPIAVTVLLAAACMSQVVLLRHGLGAVARPLVAAARHGAARPPAGRLARPDGLTQPDEQDRADDLAEDRDPANGLTPHRWRLDPDGPVAPATALVDRFSIQTWGDLEYAGAPILACPGGAVGCPGGPDEPASPRGPADGEPGIASPVPNNWVDVDGQSATINSSSSPVLVPPGARIAWAGLYWTADLGLDDSTGPGGVPRAGQPAHCDGPAGPTATAVAPPRPDLANRVLFRVDGGPYRPVTASAFTEVRSAGGSTGFQAYADVTDLLRPAAAPVAPTPVILTVADLQAAQGEGCGGGWTVVTAYSYPDGPNPIYAPQYRSLVVFDGVAPVFAGATADLALTGIVAPAGSLAPAGNLGPIRLSGALRGSGQSSLATELAVNGRPAPAPAPTAPPGLGYRRFATTVPAGAITSGSTAAIVGLTPSGDGYLAAVLGMSTPVPVRVDLTLRGTVEPATVAVGQEAKLTLTVQDEASVPAGGVIVATRLPAGLAIIGAPKEFDRGTGLWRVGEVPGDGAVSLTLRVRLEAPGSLIATAEVAASAVPDLDSTPGNRNADDDDEVALTVTGTLAGAGSQPGPDHRPLAARDRSGSGPLPAVLIGIGIFLLGAVLLIVAVVRSRAASQA
jgi:Domain of unknown function DUF11